MREKVPGSVGGVPHAIEVDGLVKRYGDRTVVDGLSFTVGDGEIFALLGPNGAGKTTTIEILEGIRSRDGGSVRILGTDPRDRRLAHAIGVMPQEAGFYAGIRPLEALRLFAALYADAEDPERMLQRVGLDAVRKTPWRRLSGGERQRLSLALALIGRPRLAFLDEPTAGMDPAGRASTWELVRRLRSDGVAVVLTTHLIDEAERLSDRVAIIHRGRLRVIGPPAELVHGNAIRFQARAGIDLTGLGALEERAGEYVVRDVEPTPEAVARLTARLAERDVRIRGLSAGARSLEDVFLELTSE
jgi:ABC-2 type transport system ATP-binding protein